MRVLRWSTLKWTLVIFLAVAVGTVMHYTLPRHAVVRVVGAPERLETLGWNRFFFAAQPAGQEELGLRDVRYVETMRPGQRELVFRNEDTGWGWPPYFKFNSADLQAIARDLISTADEPIWVAVTYYGVRNVLFTIYPNLLRIRPVAGPDVRVIPWLRIFAFILLFAAAAWLWFVLNRPRRGGGTAGGEEPPAAAPAAGRLERFWQRLTGS